MQVLTVELTALKNSFKNPTAIYIHKTSGPLSGFTRVHTVFSGTFFWGQKVVPLKHKVGCLIIQSNWGIDSGKKQWAKNAIVYTTAC